MQAAEIIKNFEGLRLEAYICPAGFKTIGYGHVIKPYENYYTITEEQAQKLLESDISQILRKINKLINEDLNHNQLSALISFTYNVGIAALQRSTLRQKINRGEHECVPEELLKWVYAKGKKLYGLVKRRELEAYIYSL